MATYLRRRFEIAPEDDEIPALLAWKQLRPSSVEELQEISCRLG
jgi:hypothetical protein